MRSLIVGRLLASPARVAMTRTMAGALVVLVVTGACAHADLYRWEVDLTGRAVDLPDGVGAALEVIMQSGNRLAVAAVALVFLIADRPRRAGVALLAGWGAWFAAALAKWVVGRPRPSADILGFSPQDSVTGNGYPSSHVAVAVALAVVVVTAVGVPRWLKAATVVAAALTGVARLHLGVHWPLDVLGGVAVGIIVAGLVIVAIDPAPIPAAWPGVGRWPPAQGGALAVTSTAPGDRVAPLRVATFNIRNGWAFDGWHAWPFRRAATAAMITSLDADLLALQEVYAFQRRWLERRVAGRDWIGVGRTDGLGRGEQCPISWRPSRLRLEAWEVRWFGETPDIAGSRMEAARSPRIATIARWLDPSSNVRFGVANVHLDAARRANRARSAELLLEWVADHDVPWLLIGDLNDEPGGVVSEILEAGGFRSVGPDDGRGTFHRFTGRTDGRRIDHVFMSNHWSAGPAEVVTKASGRLPSDHWPVVVDLWPGDSAASTR